MTDLQIVIATLREEAARLEASGLEVDADISLAFDRLADKLEVRAAEKAAEPQPVAIIPLEAKHG